MLGERQMAGVEASVTMVRARNSTQLLLKTMAIAVLDLYLQVPQSNSALQRHLSTGTTHGVGNLAVTPDLLSC